MSSAILLGVVLTGKPAIGQGVRSTSAGASAARGTAVGLGAEEREMVAMEQERRGVTWVSLEDAAIRERLAGTLVPEDVAVLAEVEALLVAAREHQLQLRDRAARNDLARAKELSLRCVHLPGASRWLADVEAAMGVLAAQEGDSALAEAALQRALVLDPTRTIRLGEAPPGVVARSEALQRALRDAPSGTMRVELPGVVGARVFLDERPLGEAPVTVRATVGRHVLRVEAPGFVPYGAALDFFVGAQPPAEVHLSEHAELAQSRRLRAALGSAQHLATVPAQLQALGLHEAWWVREAPRGPRRLLGRCEAAGCGVPIRLQDRDPGTLATALRHGARQSPRLEGAMSPTEQGDAMQWLGAQQSVVAQDAPDPWPWVALATGLAVLGGATAAILFANDSDDAPQLEVRTDPCLLVDSCP